MLDVPKALHLALIEGEYISAAVQWRSLSGGRTNRVWRIPAADSAGSSDGALVCKLFNRATDNPLYPNLPGAEYEALKALSERQISPRPVALLNTDAGEALLYQHLTGTAWQSGTTDVARLLSKLHGLTLDVPLRQIDSGSAALIRQTNAILAQCETAKTELPAAPYDPQVAPARNLLPIHTDVVASNLIVTDDGLRLIDWQCPGLGDPCEDLASFLSPAMQSLYGAGPLRRDQIAEFLSAYQNAPVVARYLKLAPLFHWRSAAYCLWKAERGNKDYRQALEVELFALQKTRKYNDKAG